MEKKKTGRPSKYSTELAAEICERLSNGEPLRQICRDDHMPAWQKIYEWMARDEELSGAIARARDQGYEAIAEEALIIVCTPEDAYVCFMRTGIDVLVLDDFVLLKSEQPPWQETVNWREEFGLD